MKQPFHSTVCLLILLVSRAYAAVPLPDLGSLAPRSSQTMNQPNANAQTTAESDLAWWAQQPQIGPEGRALPVCGTWSSIPSSNGWNDRYTKTQIEQGHHVLFNTAMDH